MGVAGHSLRSLADLDRELRKLLCERYELEDHQIKTLSGYGANPEPEYAEMVIWHLTRVPAVLRKPKIPTTQPVFQLEP